MWYGHSHVTCNVVSLDLTRSEISTKSDFGFIVSKTLNSLAFQSLDFEVICLSWPLFLCPKGDLSIQFWLYMITVLLYTWDALIWVFNGPIDTFLQQHILSYNIAQQ